MSRINELIGYVGELRYEDLPQEVIDSAKKSILDTLGCVMAGSSAEGCKTLVDLTKEWGVKPEGTILVFGGKVPAPDAALVNATLARACDFDELHKEGGGHVSATIVPAALVMSEYSQALKHKVIDGKKFILGVVLGTDLNVRLRRAGKEMACRGGWQAETFAPLAIAALGGKLLGFDRQRTHDAMGIAYQQCCCNVQAVVDAGLTVRLGQGLAARAGVFSVILADRGFTGAKDILDGEFGLYSLYTHGSYDPEILMGGLGKRFESMNTRIKQYPSCGLTHPAIHGVLDLALYHSIKGENVANIVVRAGTYGYNLCGCGEAKFKPQSVIDAQFSYAYTTATALVRGKVSIDDFTEDAIRDPRVLELAQRVKVEFDPEKDISGKITQSTNVEINTKDGKSFKKCVDKVKDSMSWDELSEKFRDCNRFSVNPMAGGDVDHVIQAIINLELVRDVTDLARMLSGQGMTIAPKTYGKTTSGI